MNPAYGQDDSPNSSFHGSMSESAYSEVSSGDGATHQVHALQLDVEFKDDRIRELERGYEDLKRTTDFTIGELRNQLRLASLTNPRTAPSSADSPTETAATPSEATGADDSQGKPSHHRNQRRGKKQRTSPPSSQSTYTTQKSGDPQPTNIADTEPTTAQHVATGRVAELESERERLEQRVAELEAAAESTAQHAATDRVAELESERESLEQRVAELEAAAESTAQHAATDRVAELESERESLEQRVAELEAAAESTAQHAATDRVAELESERERLEQRVAELEARGDVNGGLHGSAGRSHRRRTQREKGYGGTGEVREENAVEGAEDEPSSARDGLLTNERRTRERRWCECCCCPCSVM